ncbi:MAG: glycosyltransferase family 2 protein, partial [Candidatus Rokuibacteriota bacterium]
GFDLVRTDHYLSPNHARNLGLRRARTPWIVFIDNDVVVTPGWLPRLVACGDESGADIVSPLLCEGTPVHSIIHCAGGETGVRVEAHADGSPTRHIIEKIARQGQRVSDVRGELKRAPTGLAEFHCMLVRASVLERLGALDERMLNTKEHVDLCMTVSAAGGAIYFEPTSVVTYVPGPPLAWSDMPFYMLRWSDAWEMASLKHLQKKWHLAEDTYFIRRYQSVGGRRRVAIVRPLVRALRLGRFTPRAEGGLVRVDRVLNGYLTRRYARRHLDATG